MLCIQGMHIRTEHWSLYVQPAADFCIIVVCIPMFRYYVVVFQNYFICYFLIRKLKPGKLTCFSIDII